MEFKEFKNSTGKILKEYWLTPSEWDALDKTTVQNGDIYHIVGTIDKGDLSADVNASLAKADSSLQKPTATLAKESFVKVGIDGTQKFDENSYVIAPSTDGTSGQVLKKTEAGTEWANESGPQGVSAPNLCLVEIQGLINGNDINVIMLGVYENDILSSFSNFSNWVLEKSPFATGCYFKDNEVKNIFKVLKSGNNVEFEYTGTTEANFVAIDETNFTAIPFKLVKQWSL